MMVSTILAARLVAILAVSLRGAPAEPKRPADGEPESRVERAQAEFERGVALFEHHDLAGALAAFEQAYELQPHPELLYNIGVVQLELGDSAAATRSLARYLVEGGDEVSARRRREVESHLEVLAGRVGRLLVRCDVDGAVVRVDGESVGTTPFDEPVVLNPGTRRVAVSAPGHVESHDTVVVVAGQDLQLKAVLVPQASVRPALGPTGSDASPRRDPRVQRLKISTYVTLGLTGAFGIASIATGVLAVRKDDEVRRQLQMIPADPVAVSILADDRAGFIRATNGLIGATAVMAAVSLSTGVAALVLQRRHARRGVEVSGLTLRF